MDSHHMKEFICGTLSTTGNEGILSAGPRTGPQIQPVSYWVTLQGHQQPHYTLCLLPHKGPGINAQPHFSTK